MLSVFETSRRKPLFFGGGLFVQSQRKEEQLSFIERLRGVSNRESTYVLTRWIFLRLLGITYFCTFLSLWGQISGLIGSQGIAPAGELLHNFALRHGADAVVRLPTLFWLSSADVALYLGCMVGIVFSIIAIVGPLPQISFAVLWIVALSFVNVGGPFTGSIGDQLLLEVGFVSIFFVPRGLYPGLKRTSPVSTVILFILWWILFRLTFESGVMQLLSPDPDWSSLTVLDRYFETQPLPTWLAWHAHHLSPSIHFYAAFAVLAIELIFPFLIYGPRKWRLWSFAALTLLHLGILLTGNYGVLSPLALGLCLLLLDDAAWIRPMPDVLLKWLGRFQRNTEFPLSLPTLLVDNLLGIFILLLSGLQTVPPLADMLMHWIQPLHVFNNYAFADTVSAQRMEITIEGSDDQVHWQPYRFSYKPEIVTETPRFIVPFSPRLDAEAVKIAQAPYDENSWFHTLLLALLEGRQPVLALFRENPFAVHPPASVRAVIAPYRFSSHDERAKTGAWWVRGQQSEYGPVLTLRRSEMGKKK